MKVYRSIFLFARSNYTRIDGDGENCEASRGKLVPMDRSEVPHDGGGALATDCKGPIPTRSYSQDDDDAEENNEARSRSWSC